MIHNLLHPPAVKLQQQARANAERELELHLQAVEYHTHMAALYQARLNRLSKETQQ